MGWVLLGCYYFLSYLYILFLYSFQEPASPVLGTLLLPELIPAVFGSPGKVAWLSHGQQRFCGNITSCSALTVFIAVNLVK